MVNGTGWKEAFLNEEGKPENGSKEQEERFFDKIAEDIKEVVRHFETDNKRPLRGNHAKILAGIADARFRVSPDIPADLAVGFLQPGKEYKAIVRFSNASSEFSKNDAEPPDLRGVAVRVIAERDQDFLMTNAERHHARDAREAMITILAATKGDFVRDLFPVGGSVKDKIASAVGAGAYLFTHLKPTTAKRIAGTLRDQMARVVKSLATEDYWSRAPIAIGKNPEDGEQSVAVKYKLTAVAEDESGDPQNLGQELKDRVSRGDVKFLFEVQRFVDSKNTPIEDATVVWTPASPFRTIAELIIPQHTETNDPSVDGLMFSPWNIDLANFRPIGSMNRSRKKVYEASASLR
jgi:hypothetical protein